MRIKLDFTIFNTLKTLLQALINSPTKRMLFPLLDQKMVDENNKKIKGASIHLEVLRKEVALVKPESETPKGLFFLSNLDLILTDALVSTIYCFKSEERGNEEAVQVIKKALSQLLVHYHPLAGRFTISHEGKLAVDCTGKGAVFVEAEANCKMDEFGDYSQPCNEYLAKLVYVNAVDATNIFDSPLVTAQVTKFKCGGFVFGLCVNHCMFDGPSAMDFVTSWGQLARGLPLTSTPFLDRTILRARDPPKIEYPHHEILEMEDKSNNSSPCIEEPVLFKSFCFDPERIKKLKLQGIENTESLYCTTFEAISAFVWRARTKSLKMLSCQKTKLLIVADGRAKFEPPLPERYFGNGIFTTGSVCEAGELMEKPLSFAVGLVRKAVKMVTDGYMRSGIDYYEVTRARSSLFSTLVITTWSGLDFHVANFGWGKPIFTGPAAFVKEIALFLSHGEQYRRSIDVVVGLPASAMDVFQEQFLQI